MEGENSGGLLVHKATHHFDLVNWWLSSVPETVFARGQRRFYIPRTAERYGLTRRGERCLDCPEAAAATSGSTCAARRSRRSTSTTKSTTATSATAAYSSPQIRVQKMTHDKHAVNMVSLEDGRAHPLPPAVCQNQGVRGVVSVCLRTARQQRSAASIGLRTFYGSFGQCRLCCRLA